MTLVVAHRGASQAVPENTMEAFQAGVDAGADAIELDVHMTADGALAVIHDPTLDRTTDRTTTVATATLADIKVADAGWAFPGEQSDYPFRGKGMTIPTLPEVVAWLPAGIGLAVEIKAPAAAEAVVGALAGSAVRESRQVTVMSFQEGAIDRVRELAPDIPTGLLLVPGDSFERGLKWVVEHGHAAVLPYDTDLGDDPTDNVALATSWNARVGSYVVNDPERMQQLAAAGLWGFVTDVPDVARATLGPRPVGR
ncbi:MAG TPA: glycerophosphodiester phosphodiesterase [Candidatus Limnocylindria bacterium]